MKNSIVTLMFLSLCICVSAVPPAISGFLPLSAASGMTVVISGTDFSTATSVKFGTTPAASFVVVSATRINAVVGAGSSGQLEVTNADGTGSRAGFVFVETSGIITDFNGYWNSTGAAPNVVSPDNSHNLLAFTYNNITYSTGVNDTRLDNNGVSYSPGSFKALPVAGIGGVTATSGGSIFIALAKNVDGSSNVGNTPAVSHYTVMKSLTDGINGLDLGTGVTNLPSTATMSFQIFNINPASLNDAEPDLVLTQIASPSVGNDIFSFVDASGVVVGNSKTQDMTMLPSFGVYQLDLFNLTPKTSYNTASAYSHNSVGTREIRLTAFKLSEFGITPLNVGQVAALKIAPSNNSDYAFIAYNANSINLPPNVSRHDAGTNETICPGGAASFEVVAAAASGGTLSYAWEEFTTAVPSWTVLSESAVYSGVNTSRLRVANPLNGNQYRVRITETGNVNGAVSSIFNIVVAAPAPPTSVSVTGGSTVCRNNAVQLNSTIVGGTTIFYQWQKNIAGTYEDIIGANTDNYVPPVNATGSSTYRLLASGASGCAAVISNTATVNVTGISGTSPAAACIGSPVPLAASATGGTIDWYSADFAGSSLFTGNSYSPAGLSASRVYYVASSGCASALRVPVTATIHPTTAGGSISGGTSVNPGVNNTTLSLNTNIGSVLKWQSSTDAFNINVNDIANSSSQLQVTNLNENTQFRALVQSGSCPAAFSSSAGITMFVTLAINNKSIKVSAEKDGAMIQWSASSGTSVAYYEVERSDDGVSFIANGRVYSASGHTSIIVYKWFDIKPLAGNSYYRVKETGNDGQVSYSDIVNFSMAKIGRAVSVYPNPVAGFNFQLKLHQANEGAYMVRILNTAGQALMQKQYQHNRINQIQTINMPSNIKPGNYKVVVVSGNRQEVFNLIVL